MSDLDEVIDLLEEVEASFEDLKDAHFSDLQTKVAEMRERLMKHEFGFVYCLDDEKYFDWANKVREDFKPLYLFDLTIKLQIMATGKCDAQMNTKEMIDESLDHRARLLEITKVRELVK